MVKTRSMRIRKPEPGCTMQNLLAEINDKAMEMSPGNAAKKIFGTKRRSRQSIESAALVQEIKNVRRNFAKVTDRILAARPQPEKSPMQLIHDAIQSGEARINLKPVRELNGTALNAQIDKIFGITRENGHLQFLIKWQNIEEAQLVDANVAHLNFPQQVIAFYETKIFWQT